jgi:hypothetical protein
MSSQDQTIEGVCGNGVEILFMKTQGKSALPGSFKDQRGEPSGKWWNGSYLFLARVGRPLHAGVSDARHDLALDARHVFSGKGAICSEISVDVQRVDGDVQGCSLCANMVVCAVRLAKHTPRLAVEGSRRAQKLQTTSLRISPSNHSHLCSPRMSPWRSI